MLHTHTHNTSFDKLSTCSKKNFKPVYLQWNDNHKQFFVLIGQYMFDERPSGSNQHNCDKKHSAFESSKFKKGNNFNIFSLSITPTVYIYMTYK